MERPHEKKTKRKEENSRKRSGSLVTSLIDIPRRRIVRPQHRHDSIRVPVRSRNIRSPRPDVVNVKTDSSGRLGDHRTSLEGIVDALDRVFLHGDEEARGELRVGGTSVEELQEEERTTNGRLVGRGVRIVIITSVFIPLQT